MTTQSYLPRRFFRLTMTVLAVACLAVSSVAFPPVRAEAGSFEIPAWTFDRGNAQVYPHSDKHADAGLMVGEGCESPWVVEYDIALPVTATYTLHVHYAAAESRPIDVLLDGQVLGKCWSTIA